MRSRTIGLIVIFALGLFAGTLPADAQKPGKVYRIGILSMGSGGVRRGPGRASFISDFQEGLREHGWEEGKNVVIHLRRADFKAERLVGLATELARLPVDLILAPGTQAALAAKQATKTIPIVTIYAADPVESGLVASLTEPGGNVTGVAWLFRDMGAKQLELLREVVPELSRVSVLWNASNPGQNEPRVRAMQALALSIGVQLQVLGVYSAEDFDRVFSAIISERAEALLVVGDPFIYRHRTQIADFALRHGLPSAFSIRPFAEAGGLIAYAPSIKDSSRRAATYVDKILKGASPADLPMERPTAFDLVINLKTAKALGLTIPATLLVLADKVIR